MDANPSLQPSPAVQPIESPLPEKPTNENDVYNYQDIK
jgi:hypothetical protein